METFSTIVAIASGVCSIAAAIGLIAKYQKAQDTLGNNIDVMRYELDNNFKSVNDRLDKIESRLTNNEDDIGILREKVAVLEYISKEK